MKFVCFKNRLISLLVSVILVAALAFVMAACGDVVIDASNSDKTDKTENTDSQRFISSIKPSDASDAANIAMTAIISGDRDTMEGIMSAKFGGIDGIKEKSETMVLDEKVRSEYDITFEIGETEKVSNLDAIKNGVAKGGVLTADDVTDAERVTVEITLKKKSEKPTTKTRHMIFSYEDGAWRLYELA